MEEPKVSIIIPTYKRPERLTRAIDSVLSQTYKNIEIIVVDDNDPDTIYRAETEKEMQKYKNNSVVKYIKHNCNMNGAVARNTGIKNCNGEFIAFLDDDDEFLQDKIEKQVNKLQELDDSWGACYTSYKKLNKNNSVQYSAERREGMLLTEALMRSLYLGSGSNLMIRKSVVDKIKGFDESFLRNQDIEFLVRILENYKLAYVDSCSLIVHYEIRENQKTYEQLKEVDLHYISKFQYKISRLSKKEQKKVFTMIALDNFRNAMFKKQYKEGLKVLIENKVNIIVLTRYVYYIFHRYITKTSYGFNL